MKVLQLLGPSTGGIRRHVAYLDDHLGSLGIESDLAGPATVFADLQLAFPVDLDVVVDIPGGVDPRAVVRARRQLAAVASDYDLIHAHGLKAGWIATLVGARPPVVVSVHNLVLDDVAGRSAPVLRWLEDRIPARADHTIAVSGQIASRFAGHRGADRITVIPPAGPPPVPMRTGAEVRRELGVDGRADLVVTAARLHPQKGLDTLLDAAASVLARRPGLRWFVFGDGPAGEEFRRAITARGLDGVVHAAGARPRVDDELAAADVVVVTSTWESGPLVVLEAIALDRPVVSTRVGLATDVLAPPSGLVVDVGDGAAMADAIVGLLADPPESGVQLPSSAVPMRPEMLANAVASVYREVLAR